MRFTFRTMESPAQVLSEKADTAVLPLSEGSLDGDPLLSVIDAQLGGSVRQALNDEQFAGKSTQSVVLHTQGRIAATRLMLLGTGKPSGVLLADVRTYAARAVRGAFAKAKVVLICITSVSAEQAAEVGQAVAEGALLSTYQFDKYLSGERKRRSSVEEVVVLLPSGVSTDAASAGAARGQIVAEAVCLTRDLVNEQPTEMCPRRLAEVATSMAQRRGFDQPRGRIAAWHGEGNARLRQAR